MKITFLGATQEVTGSKYLIEHEQVKILVDCGLFQGGRELTKHNWDTFPLAPESIDALVLTHAHLDHTGYIPLLVKNGFKGTIYCSRATYELSAIILADSGNIQEEEAKAKSDFQHAPVLPLYTKRDAENSLKFFKPIDYDTVLNIQGLQITLIRSGHILGSAFVIISDGKQKLTFSGDLGSPHQFIMKAPPHLKETDFLVLESTYGDRIHDAEDPIKALGDIVNETVKKGGVLVIPAFAAMRTQIILYCLHQLKQKNIIPDLSIFLDSPTAISITKLFCKFTDEYTISKAACNTICDTATYTDTPEQSKQLDRIKHPAIIIAGSGMASGGRMMYHLQNFISDHKNTIAFVGFQGEGTLGRALIKGATEITLWGTMYTVRAEIKTIGAFSAHADYKEILDWLSYFKTAPKKVFITHGELSAAQSLKQKIEERFGWPVVIPKYQDSFDLD